MPFPWIAQGWLMGVNSARKADCGRKLQYALMRDANIALTMLDSMVVPRALFEGFVLPYASVNEARTDWRGYLWGALKSQPWLTSLPAGARTELRILRN